jgi:hypothetical protein
MHLYTWENEFQYHNMARELSLFWELCRAYEIPFSRAVSIHPDGAGVRIEWVNTQIQCWLDPGTYALQGAGDLFWDSRDIYAIIPPLLELLSV